MKMTSGLETSAARVLHSTEMRVLVGVALLTFHLGNARRAIAQSVEEPIRLSYRALPSCPSREEFLGKLRERARVREAKPEEPARHFEVTIEGSRRGFSGHLVIYGAEGKSARQLEAPTCAELARALTLVARLAVDPSAIPEIETPHDEGSTKADGAVTDRNSFKDNEGAVDKDSAVDRGSAKDTDDPADALLREPPESAELDDELPEEESAPRSLEARAFQRELRAFLGGARLGAMAPSPLWAVRAGTELEWAGRPILSPALRLAFEYAPRIGFPAAGGRGHVRYLGATLTGCPLALRAGPLGVRACATGNAGWIRSDSSGVPNPDGASRPWVDLGPEGRLFAEAGSVRLELGAAWIFPLVRDRYYLADQLIYRVPKGGLRAGLDLSLQFL